jgi:hypothetical protein
MRGFYLLSFLMVSSSLFANEVPWQNFRGCFEARDLSVNGIAREASGAKIENGRGSIRSHVSDPVTQEPLPSINITVWGLDPVFSTVAYKPYDISVFNDRGDYRSDDKGSYYSFSGTLTGEGWDEVNWRSISRNYDLDSSVILRTMPNREIALEFGYKAVETESGKPYQALSVKAVLKQRPCCDPTTSLCQSGDVVE